MGGKLKFPYCPQCGALFPAGEGITHCKLCYEQYLLVSSEENRRKRYRNFKEFWDKHGYTRKERRAIPMSVHLLLGPTCRAVKHMVQKEKFPFRGRDERVEVEVWRKEPGI